MANDKRIFRQDKRNDITLKCPNLSELTPGDLSPCSFGNLLDEVTSEIALRRIQQPQTGEREQNEDEELITSLARKNGELIKQMKHKDEIIRQQCLRIKTLENKLKLVERNKCESNPNISEVQVLQACCEKLQRQVFEMEEFLHDYGLVWVGTQTTDEQSGPLGLQFGTPEKEKLIMDKVVTQIQALNEWFGAGEVKVARDPNNPRRGFLKDQNTIPLTLYADGICLYSGPFRPFTDHSTMQFLQDILDGFFPSELESSYPDGVPFLLTDKRDIKFLDSHLQLRSKGHKLGGADQSSQPFTQNRHEGANVESSVYNRQIKGNESENSGLSDTFGTLELYTCTDRQPLTFEDLLSRLPERTVTRSGRLINIRKDLQDEFGTRNKASDIEHIKVECGQSFKDTDKSVQDMKFVSLRVRSEDGSKIFNLRMAATDTVGQLYSCLNLARSEKAKTPYQLVTMSPFKREYSAESVESTLPVCSQRRVLNDKEMTLEEAGISTRTMLRMEKVEHSVPPADHDRVNDRGCTFGMTEWSPSKSQVSTQCTQTDRSD
ncbi:unnamed protein product [Calicophoron daubneyi]|uniref:UBX domain-containing protein 11 n=1 Tax=Calicophoron daubneyi TaxID=300641 RepID=A0AAV2TDM3_CALDB